MAIPLYLAMTAAEFSRSSSLPEHPAWMSCRFSPGGRGLSNLPSALPEGSLLILDDQTPPSDHNIALILQQLTEVIERNHCSALLLDFQRPDDQETAQIAARLLSLPCPVCVSHLYAKALSCPVFVPLCPLTTPLSQHLAPWDGHEIWLETALESLVYSITEAGCKTQPCDTDGGFPFHDDQLHCRYRIELTGNSALFSLKRNSDDLAALLDAAASMGVTRAVGLYQELAE